MSVNSTDAFSGPYTATGTAQSFPFTFTAASRDEVQVTADGIDVDPTTYSVTLNSDGTGAVNATLPAGAEVFVESNPDFQQSAQFSRFAPYFPDAINVHLDRAAIRDIALADRLDRTFVIPRRYQDAAGKFARIGDGGGWELVDGVPGIPGAAAAFRGTLAELKAAAVTDRQSTYDGSLWLWTPGNFSATPAAQLDVNVVKANSTALTAGAWVRQGATGLTYRLPAAAAQPQTQADKNEQTIDVFDALTPAMRSAMRGGSYVDVGPAIDAICDYAAGAESSGTVGGVTLWMKGGRYSSSVPLRNTIRYDKQITDDGDCRRMNLCGDGSANTMFYYEGPDSMPAYSVKGFNGGNGHDLYHVIEGLRIRRQNKQRGTGIGVKMLDVADVHWIDVHVDGFNLGIDAEGVLGWLAKNLFILGNNAGILARVGDGFTRPNAWQFLGGKLSGNSVYGAQFTDAANIGFRGTRFEANGAGQVGNEPNKANQFVLRMLGAPAEGGAWLDLDNCYFENNNVETEVLLATAAASIATVGIRACSFQRISDIRNPNRHIDFAATGTGKVHAHLDAVAFRSIGSRTPNPAFKAWRNQTANTIVTTTATAYESTLEGPDSGNFPWIGKHYNIMRVDVNADGAYNADPAVTNNIREVQGPALKGTGKYTLYTAANINPANAHFIATVRGNTGSAVVTFIGPSGIDIEVRDMAGNLVNRDFTVNGEGVYA